MRRAVLLAVAWVAAAAPPPAEASPRYAVGLAEGASPSAVERALARASARVVSRDLLSLGALTVTATAPAGLVRLPGVAWVEPLDGRRRQAFAPNDPLAARQWHLGAIRAFDYWLEPPVLPPVKVAVVDSGIDGDHPEFARSLLQASSFVGGSGATDEHGHGTFVAGLIAAATNNGIGVAGIGVPTQLLVAKVVRPDGTVSIEAEAKAIRWAADRGARVINLSLGGLRDPFQLQRDAYSPLEAAAVAYAQRRGALVVAAVGNGTDAPAQPWLYADYPAALPHVLGVSALARDGSVPPFSNRDALYADLAAPGQDIVSTLPRALTAAKRSCPAQGYSDCGPEEYRRARGTSYAAPQATGAAALLLGLRPWLAAEQVAYALTRTAADASPETGCVPCPAGRDELTGWGRLDVTAALTAAAGGRLLRPDALEPNDDAGRGAPRLWGRRGRSLRATVDFWDDQSDVYRVHLRPGTRLRASLRGPAGTRLFLWRPGAARIDSFSLHTQRLRVAQSGRRGARERLVYRVPPARSPGWYSLQVKLTRPGAGEYTLSFRKTRSPS